MSFHRTAESVFDAVDLTIDVARQGWEDYQSGGANRYAGLVNAIIATRSVTNVLQNLRTKVEGFDEWWSVAVTVFDNPIARWFVDVRNRIEKQGTLGQSTAVVRLNSTPQQRAEMQRHAPRGAKSIFLGDSVGRSGFIVELPDGSEQKIYYAVPRSVVDHYFSIEDAPDGRRIDELFPEWLAEVEGLVRSARAGFRQDASDRAKDE